MAHVENRDTKVSKSVRINKYANSQNQSLFMTSASFVSVLTCQLKCVIRVLYTTLANNSGLLDSG